MTVRTVISLRVSVPVLSEQITETEPSVSTAGRRRMMALRAAMRCTPIASVMVITAGRPSGIAATARPTDRHEGLRPVIVAHEHGEGEHGGADTPG